MKKLIILSLVSALGYGAICKPIKPKPITVNQADSSYLKAYVGHYQVMRQSQLFEADIFLYKDDHLEAHSLWDNIKYPIKHLKDDNFFIEAANWTVKFQRDKDNKITSLVFNGAEVWNKVEEKGK